MPVSTKAKASRSVARNRIIKPVFHNLAGFPKLVDWSRPQNDRLTTLACQIGSVTVYYSYDLPIGFYDENDPETGTCLTMLQLPQKHPWRTKTTTTHLNAMLMKHPTGWKRYLSPEVFEMEFRQLLSQKGYCGE